MRETIQNPVQKLQGEKDISNTLSQINRRQYSLSSPTNKVPTIPTTTNTTNTTTMNQLSMAPNFNIMEPRNNIHNNSDSETGNRTDSFILPSRECLNIPVSSYQPYTAGSQQPYLGSSQANRYVYTGQQNTSPTIATTTTTVGSRNGSNTSSSAYQQQSYCYPLHQTSLLNRSLSQPYNQHDQYYNYQYAKDTKETSPSDCLTNNDLGLASRGDSNLTATSTLSVPVPCVITSVPSPSSHLTEQMQGLQQQQQQVQAQAQARSLPHFSFPALSSSCRGSEELFGNQHNIIPANNALTSTSAPISTSTSTSLSSAGCKYVWFPQSNYGTSPGNPLQYNLLVSQQQQQQQRQKLYRPHVVTSIWEEEHTLLYHVEANGVTVIRRADNDWINGTKLLNVTKMTRGRRDGILRGEKLRKVVKIGSMHLIGVWIPFERARKIAEREKILDLLYPLFVRDIRSLLPLDPFGESFQPDREGNLFCSNTAVPAPISSVNLPPLTRTPDVSFNHSSFDIIRGIDGERQQQQFQRQITPPPAQHPNTVVNSGNTRILSTLIPTTYSVVPGTSRDEVGDSKAILSPPPTSSSSNSVISINQRSVETVESTPPSNRDILNKRRRTQSSSFPSSAPTPVLLKAPNTSLFGSVKDGGYSRVVLPEPLKNGISASPTVIAAGSKPTEKNKVVLPTVTPLVGNMTSENPGLSSRN